MKKNILYIIWLLLFALPVLLFSQKSEEKVKHLIEAVNNIDTHGEEKFFSMIKPMIKSPENRYETLHSLYIMGLYYSNKETADSILYFGHKLMDLTESGSDSLSLNMLNKAYVLLGSGYRYKGLDDTGKGFNLKGIDLYEKGLVSDNQDLSYHIRALAFSYKEKKEYDKAIELYKRCTELNINKAMLYGTFISMGIIYGTKKEYHESIEHFRKAYEICIDEGDYKCQAYCLSNIGASFQEIGNSNEALAHYEKAMEIAEKYNYNNSKLTTSININIGSIYEERNLFDKALPVYQKALNEAESSGYTDNQVILHEYMRNTYKAKGDFENALNHETQRSKLIDSIRKLQKSQEINELEVKYSTIQREKEIELLKKDRLLNEGNLDKEKSLKAIMLIAFLIILIPSIALLFVYYQKLTTQNQLNKKLEEINQQKITTLIKDQELELIKASIDGQDNERKRIAQELHDSIGGNLAAIKLQFGSIANGKKIYSDINKQIDLTYKQVRTISHNLIPKKFSQNPFLSVINEYMGNIGKASNLKISCNAYPEDRINDIDENIKVEIFKILQELITNTIKHARATDVDIQFNLFESSISLLFEDNGLGFDSEKTPEGIGLANIKSRLKRIKGDFNIDSKPNRGTIVNIEIPITIIQNET